MKVKCVRTKVSEFPFESEEHLSYYRDLLRGSDVDKSFSDLVVGRVYVVYAVRIRKRGYPFYFVKTSDRPFFDYHLQPSPCFEIVDGSVSKFWHCHTEIHVDKRGNESISTTLAIREWTDGFDFLHRIIDEKSPEIEIWEEAARKIEAEAGL